MITIPKKEYELLKAQLSEALLVIKQLQIDIQLLKNGRKSDTSSTPSSQDYNRSNRNNLREKTDANQEGNWDTKVNR